MGFLSKLKLLFIVQKPLGEITEALEKAKKTKKWVQFSATVLSILGTSVASFNGYMDPQVAILVSAGISALYNVVRGAEKANYTDVKGPFTSTEFYSSVLTEAQKFVVVANNGGINAPWLSQLSTGINMLGLVIGQFLAAQAPVTPEETAPKS